MLTFNRAYHDFDQSRLFLSILLILEIVEKIKILEDEITEFESSDTMMIEHEKNLIEMKLFENLDSQMNLDESWYEN